MSYYAPFLQPINYYNPNIPNGMQGQNFQQQPYSNQPQNTPQPNVAQMPQTDTSMIWVLNKNEADSYPVAPNCQVVLWDRNDMKIYIKSRNANGEPNMRTLDYTECTEMPQNVAKNNSNNLTDKFVSVDDFASLRSEFEELRAKYAELERAQYIQIEEKPKATAKKTKGGEE